MDLRHGGRTQEVDAELRPGQGAFREKLHGQSRLDAREARLTAGTTNTVVPDVQQVAGGPVRTLPAPEGLGIAFHGQWVHA
ncbi:MULTISPECIES: hypothetical protein [Streptomyces]|uniref:Uncharacterized protein n=1 Tax=Streptomyces anulatus TaxID=1892 RepID=A0A7K3RDJ8_STRAQ|nr:MULTISPECIES: hypothetical protein [Streptomyces]NDZ58052.1 hypothetical protein [Streptomyces anulatus]NEC00067.1 hypothetical protein [Streptomyces anulatus]NED29385.1 hypothetical protein [Streptomyces anulatus]